MNTRTPQTVSLAVQSRFHRLQNGIAGFQNPAAPSEVEKRYLWLLAFEILEEQTAAGKAPKKTKRALLQYLDRVAPWLVDANAGDRASALRVNFHRKYARWIASGRDASAIADARPQNSGRFRGPELTQEDQDRLTAHAVLNCGGRISQAWRELVARNELTAGVIGYYLNNPASKSHVPRTVRDAVKYEVAMMEDIHHGPRQHKLNGAHLLRDWSGVHSLDWYQGDDFTFPVYFKAIGENGEWILMRGQVLLMIDLRSTRILGFVLIPERNYNANAIRTLITHVADTYGLPRKGFYFENGSWRAKILAGNRNAEAMSWPETEQGLKEFGLRFVHADLPRAKPVERVGGALQNIMEGLPAYVGRNEMVEKFERTQKHLARARNGDAAALAQIMDHAEWSKLLEQLCERYNADRQDGKMTCGLSPNEAFEQFANLADPSVKFTGDVRYLLAQQRRAVRVTSNGITLRDNKQVFNYRNAETGKLRGQTMLAWFNPELPEILTITDMKRQNPFTIARTQEVPAMDAPPEIIAQEMERIAQHNAHPKARYHVLKSTYAIPFRSTVADRETIELGAQIGAQRSDVLHQAAVQTRQEAKGRRAAGALGMALPQNKLRRPETAPALERLNELLADDSDTGATKETQS